jgi:hypothetical protein
MKRKEDSLQEAIIRYFRLQYPERYYRLFSNHNNAESGRQGAKAKRMGRVAGVADLTYLTENGVIFIELKTDKGRQRKEQREFQKVVEGLGIRYVILRSISEAVEFFKNN